MRTNYDAMRAQYAKNTETFRGMLRQARLRGGRCSGYTATELEQKVELFAKLSTMTDRDLALHFAATQVLVSRRLAEIKGAGR